MKLIQFVTGFLKNHPARMSQVRWIADMTMNTIREGDQVSVFRVITNNDIFKFAELTGDHNPIHFNTRKQIVHGAFINGLVSGIIGTKLPGPGTIVIEQNLVFPKPCFAGDAIELTVKLLSIRKIITCTFICIANGDRVVMKGEAKLMRKMF